jgi:hypothetical protein
MNTPQSTIKNNALPYSGLFPEFLTAQKPVVLTAELTF